MASLGRRASRADGATGRAGAAGQAGPTGPPGPQGEAADTAYLEEQIIALEARVTALEEGKEPPPPIEPIEPPIEAEILAIDFNAPVELWRLRLQRSVRCRYLLGGCDRVEEICRCQSRRDAKAGRRIQYQSIDTDPKRSERERRPRHPDDAVLHD